MRTIDILLVARILFLLALANGAPVMVKKLLGDASARPIDGGLTFVDGQPLFGPSKTIRGVVFSIIATTLAAPLAGVGFATGAIVSTAAMAGDLVSSFVKRRLRIPPSGMALGLDQVPESLLPGIAAGWTLPIGVWDVVAVTAIFLVAELVASRILFALRLRDRPY